MTNRREHVEEKVAGLELPFFRQLVLDIWSLRGFGVAYRYEGEGADFVSVRGGKATSKEETKGIEEKVGETEVVSVAENGDGEDIRAVSEASESVEATGAGELRSVAVARRFTSDAENTARDLGVETVDSERLADLIERGRYFWTLYRWVALDEAEKTDEPTVVESTEAPFRYRKGSEGIVLGRAAAEGLGVGDGDVVRVGGEVAGVVSTGGMFEREGNYVAVDEKNAEAIDAEEGETVTVKSIEAEEARRVYVMSQPTIESELAAEIWKGYAPHRGTELSQPYGGGDGSGDSHDEAGGEIRTMALEVLPHDYCYVGDETDVVVEGYAGARRIFE
jgi:hypothetical protein